MMRAVDVLYSLPDIIFIVILMALFERSLLLLFVALGATSWLTMARIVRGQVLSLKNEPFIEASRCIGASHTGIILRHIVPNTLGPVITYGTLTVPSVILAEAFLSFLGLGVPPPASSLGVLAEEGAQAIAVHPILLIAPATLMAVMLLSLSLFGDALRDAWILGRGRCDAVSREPQDTLWAKTRSSTPDGVSLGWCIGFTSSRWRERIRNV
jgi:oligopeptide transport system permease protein